MSRVTISDLKGGMNTGEKTNLKNNEFEFIKDMRYDSDGRLITRNGYKVFGSKISNNPISTYIFHTNDVTGQSYVFAFSGTSFHELDLDTLNWTERKTGLTEFESDGTTKTRWSHAVYLNVLYLCNGIDNYSSYNPDTNTWTEFSAQPKCRYLKYLADAIYGGGEDANPNKLYATDAGQTNANTLDADSVLVGGDEYGRINGIEVQQQLVIVIKDKKNYSVAGDLSRVDPIDSQYGGYGQRTLKMVGSGLVYMGALGIDKLITRSGSTGDLSLTNSSISDKILSYFNNLTDKTKREASAIFVPQLNQYYLSFSEGNLGDNTTTLVYNSKIKAWTYYDIPTWNDAGTYIDAQGFEHIIIASNQTGQLYEIETGFTDNLEPIGAKFIHKSMDFNEPGLLKTNEYIDVSGLRLNDNKNACFRIKDDQNTILAEAKLEGSITTNNEDSVILLGDFSLTNNAIGGANDLNASALGRYVARIPIMASYYDAQLEGESETIFSIEKISYEIEKEDAELFTFDNII